MSNSKKFKSKGAAILFLLNLSKSGRFLIESKMIKMRPKFDIPPKKKYQSTTYLVKLHIKMINGRLKLFKGKRRCRFLLKIS